MSESELIYLQRMVPQGCYRLDMGHSQGSSHQTGPSQTTCCHKIQMKDKSLKCSISNEYKIQ